MPAETSSWEKGSLEVAITPAAFKPSILDQKNHFKFLFFFSSTHKAQLFPCYNRMVPPLHLLEDAHPTQHPQFSHTQPVLQLPSKPVLEIPSQTSSRNFPIQYPVPTSFSNPLTLQTQSPLLLPVRFLPHKLLLRTNLP